MPAVKFMILIILLLFGAYAHRRAEKQIKESRKDELRERKVKKEKTSVERIKLVNENDMKGRVFKKSMLEYCKIILKKMSFNKILFRKEYKKTFVYLTSDEHSKLKEWLRRTS